ncbi:MAG: hypothetical protein SOX85_09880 [Lachnospiraceae bacterium]|nr:hypothetical protein [Lachnospiraceae bacterium]
MTREESLAYRRSCPYDAMGDYTVFLDSNKGKGNQTDLGQSKPDISIKQVK